MNFLKEYGKAIVGLAFVLAGLMVALNVLKKAPVVGKAADKVDNLLTEGHL